MKTNLLTQVILAGLMTTVMTACQKGSDSNATPASATPAPTEATIEKPKSALEIKDEAEAQLATIGLKFVEQTEAEDVEIHLIEAKWDLDFYRKFLSEAEQKPTLETQVQLIKAYCEAVDQYLQQDLNIEPQDLENESVEDIQKIVEKTKYEARLELAAARLEKLDKRLSDRKAKEAAAAAQAPADSTDPKDPSKPVESK